MNPMTIKCDHCAAYLVLTVDLLDRLSGKSGRVTCHSCGEKIGLDARGRAMLLVGGKLAPEPELELEEAPSLRGAQLSLLPAASGASPVRTSMRAPLPPPRPSGQRKSEPPPMLPTDPFDTLDTMAPLVPLQGVRLTADGRLVNRADEPPKKPRSRVRTLAPLLVAALLGTGFASAHVGSLLPLGRGAKPAAASPHRAPASSQAAVSGAADAAQAAAPRALAPVAAASPVPAEPTAVEAAATPAPAPALRTKDEAEAKASSLEAGDPSPTSTDPAADAEASPEAAEAADSDSEVAAGDSAEDGAEAPAEAPAFSKDAATVALQHAAAEALSCRQPGDPAGSARVVVTFAPSGRVTSANISGGPFAGTATGGCIAGRFRGATVPAFSGGFVTVSKTISIQ